MTDQKFQLVFSQRNSVPRDNKMVKPPSFPRPFQLMSAVSETLVYLVATAEAKQRRKEEKQ